MSNSKPKAKDQSSNKFLQRIAGKKALAPPPTPRPVIGEHPVRTLLRENADEVETPERETPVIQTESAGTGAGPPPPAGQNQPALLTGGDLNASSDGAAEKAKTPKIAARAVAPKVKTEGKGGAPGPAGAEEKIIAIKKKYRLNSGEFSLYRELYLLTHAVGKTECSFVVSELVKSTGMLERRVRDNLRRLKKNGWLVLVEAYDFENREKAKYRVNVEPGT